MKKKGIVFFLGIFCIVQSLSVFAEEYEGTYTTTFENGMKGEFEEAFAYPAPYEERREVHGFQGPGDCQSPEECDRYDQEHKEEYRQEFTTDAKKYNREGMPPMMREISPAKMAMMMVFEQAKGMHPEEFMQYCSNPEELVDAAMQKLEEQGITFEATCDRLKEKVQECKQRSQEHCERMKEYPMHCEIPEEEMMEKCNRIQPMIPPEAMMGTPEEYPEWNPKEEQENCREDIERMREEMKRKCKGQEEMREKEYERCKEQSEHMCTKMKEGVEKCTSVTPEEIRKEMITQATMMCEKKEMFQGRHEGRNGEEVYQRTPSMERELEEASEQREEIEQQVTRPEGNGFFRFLKRLLGFQKDLSDHAEELSKSIEHLRSVSASIEDPTAKTQLEEEIRRLEDQQQKILTMTETEEESSVTGSAIAFLKAPRNFFIGSD